MSDDSARHDVRTEFLGTDCFPGFLNFAFFRARFDNPAFNAVLFDPVFERRGAITRINAESVAVEHVAPSELRGCKPFATSG